MPLQKLQFRPGINREGTSLSNEGGWFDGDKIRFRSGYPEKIGGWAVVDGVYATFLGTCRSLWNWVTLRAYNLIGVGTNLKFYIQNGGAYYDITPIRFTTSPGEATFQAGYTTLNGAITAVATTITVTSATNLPATGGLILIDSEQITYATKSGNNLINCTRGVNGTTAASHTTTTPVRSATIVVTDASAAGFISNDFVTFSAFVSLGGNITAAVLNQEYQITFISSSSFSIQARTAGTGVNDVSSPVFCTASDIGNGSPMGRLGNGVATYQVNTGKDIYTIGTGWSAGPWSRLGWGSGYTTGIGEQLRLWNQQNFGEYLLFNFRGGPMYVWQPGAGSTPNYSTRGVVLSPTSTTPIGWTSVVTDAYCPSIVNNILVSDSTRIVIAFGCNDPSGTLFSTSLDPLLIRWSAAESFNTWLPQTTNQAGDYRISHGSVIVTAMQTRQEILVWTDTALYGMQYLGAPYVWGFTLLTDNISIASPNAAATASGSVYWMGSDKFYMYSGRTETLPCAVRSYIYDNINRDQLSQVFASTNEGYNEIWWFYCSANSSVIDRYVIFNYLDRVWYYGTLGRTAWMDSPLRSYPVATTTGNLMVVHESASDDGTTNPPSPISSYVQTSDFDIGDGSNYGFVWRMLPDITFDGSTTAAPEVPEVTFSLKPRQNPGAPYGTPGASRVISAQTYGQTVQTYKVQEFTEIIYTRVRGRQLSFKVECAALGTQWQLGVPRMDIRNDGKRA